MTLIKGYTTFYCHPGVVVALAKYHIELTNTLHGREVDDYNLSSKVHGFASGNGIFIGIFIVLLYKNGIFIALSKWRMHDTTNMMQPTNTNIFLEVK